MLHGQQNIKNVNYYVITTEFFMNIKSDEQSLFKPSPTHACTESM